MPLFGEKRTESIRKGLKYAVSGWRGGSYGPRKKNTREGEAGKLEIADLHRERKKGRRETKGLSVLEGGGRKKAETGG